MELTNRYLILLREIDIYIYILKYSKPCLNPIKCVVLLRICASFYYPHKYHKNTYLHSMIMQLNGNLNWPPPVCIFHSVCVVFFGGFYFF